MNWITTNLRLPEDIYMDLKMEAAKERKSVAAVIRDRLTEKKEKKAERVLDKIQNLSGEIARENKGLNLSKLLIEMRYEQ